jgi:Arc/MetJ-type ribon-helix-helix transcriptional regulator
MKNRDLTPINCVTPINCASESEVIREGLRALMARERAVESWLHQQVGPAFDAIQADPSRGLSADQVRAHLATRFNKPA